MLILQAVEPQAMNSVGGDTLVESDGIKVLCVTAESASPNLECIVSQRTLYHYTRLKTIILWMNDHYTL